MTNVKHRRRSMYRSASPASRYYTLKLYLDFILPRWQRHSRLMSSTIATAWISRHWQPSNIFQPLMAARAWKCLNVTCRWYLLFAALYTICFICIDNKFLNLSFYEEKHRSTTVKAHPTAKKVSFCGSEPRGSFMLANIYLAITTRLRDVIASLLIKGYPLFFFKPWEIRQKYFDLPKWRQEMLINLPLCFSIDIFASVFMLRPVRASL